MPTLYVEENPGLLMWLQGWYTAMCDGDWEHSYGIRIDTLDNPGWRVHIELTGTNLAGKQFQAVEVQRDEHDWMHAWLAKETFGMACGPTNLSEGLYTFREWVSGS